MLIATPSAVVGEEQRMATDGNAYTWDEFVTYYPNDTNWYWEQASWPEICAPSPTAAIPREEASKTLDGLTMI